MGTITQHGDTVGQRKDFRHAMADIDDRHAPRLEAAHDVHEPPDISLGESRRRLIHDQHAGILGQGAGNFDALAVGHREACHLLVDVQFAAVETVEKFTGAAAHRRPVNGARGGLGGLGEEDVFGNRQFGKQQQLLMDGGDARRMGLARRSKADDVAVDPDLAAVGLVQARHYLDEGGFASAIFTEQGVNLTRTHVEGDVRHGFDAGEGLRYATQFNGKRHFVDCPYAAVYRQPFMSNNKHR